LIDIFPTVVDLAGGDPGAVDGLSLLGDVRHQTVLSEGEGFVTATDGRMKLALAQAHGRRFAELFDLAADPTELIPVTGQPSYAEAERDLRTAMTTALLSAALP
jgi:arylsulfatase A-like enzyme